MVEEAKMIPILTTGLSGMLGAKVREKLADRFLFTDMSRTTGVDITDAAAVEDCVGAQGASVVLHMAAKTDVDGCEEDQLLGEEGEAWMVNVVGTENVVNAARKTGKRIVYISTDFVFDGSRDGYTEADEPNPVNWYGRTKYEGEELVKQSGVPATIARISYPYGAQTGGKKDFIQRMQDVILHNQPIRAVTDHTFVPTHMDDIVLALALFLQKPLLGTYHVVGSRSVTSAEVIQQIAKRMNQAVRIIPVTREEYFRGRAFRPRNLVLKNDRITELGIAMRRFGEVIL